MAGNTEWPSRILGLRIALCWRLIESAIEDKGETLNLSIAGQIITPIEPNVVTIKALLGAYELSFRFKCAVNPIHEGRLFELAVNGARAFLLPPGSDPIDLGVAHSDEAIVIRQTPFVGNQELVLKLPVLPHQIDLIEVLRDGGDLNFQLDFKYRGGVRDGSQSFEQAEAASVPFHVPESSWVKQLNDSGVDKILLFEIRLPQERDLSVMDPAAQHLVQAQKHFVRGSYREVVSQCRQVTEELLRDRARPMFDEFPNGAARQAMTKADREDFLANALQLYTHLAAHSGSKDGEMSYGRTDAKMALAIASALVSRKFAKV